LSKRGRVVVSGGTIKEERKRMGRKDTIEILTGPPSIRRTRLARNILR